jgi:hypothetical protein
MQVAVTASHCAGSLGGATTGTTRAGLSIRARRPHQQPNTPTQSLARARFSDLPGLWRTLLPSERAAWSRSATSISGYALFCQLNRNLRTIGIEPSIYTPPRAPTFPAMLAIALAPVYDQAAPPRALLAWLLSYQFSAAPSMVAVLRTTSPHSHTRTVFAPSDFKITATFQPQQAGAFPLNNAWTPIHGAPPVAGTFSAVVSLIDPATGYQSPRSRIAVSWSAETVAFQLPGGVTIEVDADTVATLAGETVSIEGEIVAGQ